MKLLTPAILLAAGLAAAPGISQETPEAWISRLTLASKKPVELKLSMKLFYRGTVITSESELLYLDDRHFSQRVEIDTYWPEQKQHRRRVQRTVGDGKKQWNEITDLDTGQGMVQDMSFEEFKSRAKGDIYEGRLHPAQQLLALLDFTESQTVELSEGSVELVAEVTEKGKSKMVPMLGGVVPRKVIVELDRKTGFPRAWRIQRYTGESVLSYTFADVRFLEAEKIDPERFVFQPSGEVTAVQDSAAAEGDGKKDKQNQGKTDG